MKFFVDNNLSDKLANGMKAFGESVMHLREKFPEDAEDELWLEYVGKNGLVLITRDERIRRNPAQLNAMKRHKVRAFLLGGKKRGRCDIFRQVVRNWPRMKEYARKTKPPFVFRVPPSGTKFKPLHL